MGEILANPTTEREGIFEVGVYVCSARLVAEIRINPSHQGKCLIKNRRVWLYDIQRLAPDFWVARYPAAFLEVLPCLLADGRVIECIERCGFAGVRDIERQIVDFDAALDFQAGMRAGQLEVMGDVLKEVGKPLHPRGWHHADERAESFLIGECARLKVQDIHALAHRAGVVESRPVED